MGYVYICVFLRLSYNTDDHRFVLIQELYCSQPCFISCTYSLIYERFCGTDEKSKDNSVGLQLLGIILANSLPAYDASCGIDYDR